GHSAAATAAQKSAATPETMKGKELAPDLQKKLEAPISDTVKSYKNQDYVDILKEVSQQAGVPLEIDKSVTAIPRDKRLWTLQTTPTMTLQMLLHDQLLKQFDSLDVAYQYDKAVLTVKSAGNGTS